jgi:hypothetical protein
MSYLKEHDEHVEETGISSFDYIHIMSFLGTIAVEKCDKCSLLMVTCIHELNEWNPESTILICKLCGEELT